MIQRMDHVNIVVADMASMIRFYRDLLGFRLTKQATIRGPWIDAVTGLYHVEADVAFLEPSSGPGVELIHYRMPADPHPRPQDAPNTLGLRHIALRVQDIDALVAALKAAGTELLSPIQQVPAVQVDYADQRKRLAYCRDPEGNLVELCAFE